MKHIYYIIILINIVFTQSDFNNSDSLFIYSEFEKINKKHSSILGRNSDPKLITDISKTTLLIRKISWTILTMPGLRTLTNLLYPKTTISYFNVNNAVAFTIDDAFCGIDNKNGCMLKEVKELFKTYNAHATFFVSGTHCKNVSKKLVNELIKDGHEIANHNMMDWSYKEYSKDEFEYDLLLTKNILLNYNQEYSKWYRTPFGHLSENIQNILNKHNLINVLPDAFAHDTYIPDPKWIAKTILRQVKSGSIILIHMPETGIREWNLEAIELTLKGLQKKNMEILTLSEIEQLEIINID